MIEELNWRGAIGHVKNGFGYIKRFPGNTAGSFPQYMYFDPPVDRTCKLNSFEGMAWFARKELDKVALPGSWCEND